MSNIHRQIGSAIPATFHMISGCKDDQTSADVSNVGEFHLQNPAGKAGGACTSAFLEAVYQGFNSAGSFTWAELLRRMRNELQSKGFSQLPQLTSSRMINIHETMQVVPPQSPGFRRAVLIGINYVGQQAQLSGCHDDVNNMKNYLISTQGFREDELLILMDDGHHPAPTRENMISAFRRITEYSQPGDVVFVHYSGHGGQVVNTTGDEESGYDSSLVPVDYQSAGQIIDDEILDILVKPMKAGVHVTAVMDSCHSGTVFDLPYKLKLNAYDYGRNEQFNHTHHQQQHHHQQYDGDNMLMNLWHVNPEAISWYRF